MAWAAGHAGRREALKACYRGLLPLGERKSIEPIAARLHPHPVEPARQSLHHLLAQALWSDEAVLAEVQRQALPAMFARAPVVAWVVDDTGIPQEGPALAMEAARQYCGQLGERENCPGVSLSVATWRASLPMAYRLCLPEEWAPHRARRRKAEVPEHIEFQRKSEIALGMIRRASRACRWLWCSPVRASGRTPGFARGSRSRGFTTWWGAGGQCVCSGRVWGRCHRSGGAGAEVCHRLLGRSPARPAVP